MAAGSPVRFIDTAFDVPRIAAAQYRVAICPSETHFNVPVVAVVMPDRVPVNEPDCFTDTPPMLSGPIGTSTAPDWLIVKDAATAVL